MQQFEDWCDGEPERKDEFIGQMLTGLPGSKAGTASEPTNRGSKEEYY